MARLYAGSGPHAPTHAPPWAHAMLPPHPEEIRGGRAPCTDETRGTRACHVLRPCLCRGARRCTRPGPRTLSPQQGMGPRPWFGRAVRTSSVGKGLRSTAGSPQRLCFSRARAPGRRPSLSPRQDSSRGLSGPGSRSSPPPRRDRKGRTTPVDALPGAPKETGPRLAGGPCRRGRAPGELGTSQGSAPTPINTFMRSPVRLAASAAGGEAPGSLRAPTRERGTGRSSPAPPPGYEPLREKPQRSSSSPLRARGAPRGCCLVSAGPAGP